MIATKLKLRVYGDSCLRKKSEPVKEVGPAEHMLIASMIQTMHEEKGIGLAAPQIGINKQIFVVDIGEGPMAAINPRILKRNGSDTMEEGCLCLPGIGIKVKRSKKIQVQFTDEHNQKIECEYDDLMAKVFQHETDHLRGKMIIDYAGLKEKLKYRQHLKDLRQQSKSSSKE